MLNRPKRLPPVGQDTGTLQGVPPTTEPVTGHDVEQRINLGCPVWARKQTVRVGAARMATALIAMASMLAVHPANDALGILCELIPPAHLLCLLPS